MKFNDEVEAINAEAQKLTDQGVNIIIAVGHSGFTTDKKLQKNVLMLMLWLVDIAMHFCTMEMLHL